MSDNGIRRYGPGKFNLILDSYVWSVSLDGGCDDEIGSVSETGRWYGMMRHGHTIFRDHDPDLEALTSAEADMLRECAGVILTEDSAGFVDVEYYETQEDLDEKWNEITETDD